MTRELKDLFLLAAWAAFAMGSVVFLRFWDIQTYAVVR